MWVQVIYVPFLPPPLPFLHPPGDLSVKSAVFLFIGDFPFFELLLSSSFLLTTLMSRNEWDGSDSHHGSGQFNSLSHISWPRLGRGSDVQNEIFIFIHLPPDMFMSNQDCRLVMLQEVSAGKRGGGAESWVLGEKSGVSVYWSLCSPTPTLGITEKAPTVCETHPLQYNTHVLFPQPPS